METLIIHPNNSSQTKALIEILKAFNISFERKKTKETYDANFVATLDESISQAKQGKLKKVTLDEIWK